ncbi:DUF1707 domain-containing protein [Streptomyces sp. NPDC058372]|uniref:DUF1707 SHOCT-like domain-containing protein n=1 Tax=Streptomyces sp. NPDC058372 TaxID=3346464 RepID=UPI00364C03C3
MGQDRDAGVPGEITPSGQAELRASHGDRDKTVNVLRVAAGDGRLTSDELDGRLEAALSARTVGELTALTADLPPVSVMAGGAVAEAKDVVRIEQAHSRVERAGRWVVPRKLELATSWCDVTLDFTEAVITHDTLHVDMAMSGKKLTLITPPGVVVGADGVQLVFSKLKYRHRRADRDKPYVLKVELSGHKIYGRVVVRPTRRLFGR